MRTVCFATITLGIVLVLSSTAAAQRRARDKPPKDYAYEFFYSSELERARILATAPAKLQEWTEKLKALAANEETPAEQIEEAGSWVDHFKAQLARANDLKKPFPHISFNEAGGPVEERVVSLETIDDLERGQRFHLIKKIVDNDEVVVERYRKEPSQPQAKPFRSWLHVKVKSTRGLHVDDRLDLEGLWRCTNRYSQQGRNEPTKVLVPFDAKKHVGAQTLARKAAEVAFAKHMKEESKKKVAIDDALNPANPPAKVGGKAENEEGEKP